MVRTEDADRVGHSGWVSAEELSAPWVRQLLDGGGQQFGFHGVRCVADVPWNMEHGRISIGLGCRAETISMLMIGKRPGPVLLGSVSTGGRGRAPG